MAAASGNLEHADVETDTDVQGSGSQMILPHDQSRLAGCQESILIRDMLVKKHQSGLRYPRFGIMNEG